MKRNNWPFKQVLMVSVLGTLALLGGRTAKSSGDISPRCQYDGWIQLKIDESHPCFRVDAEGFMYYQGQKLSPSLPIEKPGYPGDEPSAYRISGLDPSGRYAIATTRTIENDYFVLDLAEKNILRYDVNKKHAYLPTWVQWPHNSKYALLYEDGDYSDGRDSEFIYRINLDTGEVKPFDFSALLKPLEIAEIAVDDFVWKSDGQHFTIDLTTCKKEPDVESSFECQHTGTAQVEIDTETMTTQILSQDRVR